jgi:predicted nucleic acid-binding Zn ribbon protein
VSEARRPGLPGIETKEPMSSAKRRGPKPLSDILGELFAARGFGRLRALKELEDAWNAAVGEPGCRQTRVGDVRRGVLNVTVAHPTLLEELAAFQKPALLAALRRDAPGTLIHDIRFRVGPIDPPRPAPASNAEPAAPKGRPGRGGR